MSIFSKTAPTRLGFAATAVLAFASVVPASHAQSALPYAD